MFITSMILCIIVDDNNKLLLKKLLVIKRERAAAAIMHSVAFVHVSVCPDCALTFKSLRPKASFFGMLQNIWVKFIHRGHRVKV